jgi:ribose transport system substrate-binding protein
MENRRMASAGAACALAALALSACGSSSGNGSAGTAAASSSGSSPKHIKVAYFELQEANTFVHAEYEGMKQVADKDGVDLVQFDGNLSAGQQVSQIQDATASGGYDGYLVEAESNSALYPVKQAIAKGIKVVSVNQPLGPNQATGASQVPGQVATVLTPASVDGNHVGQLTVQACGSAPCQVGVVVAGTAIPAEAAKLKAIRQQIGSHPNIKIVGVGQGAFTTSGGITATQNLMQSNPNINVIATTGDDMALGSQKVLTQLHKTSSVKLIGGAASTTGVAQVRAGNWFGTTTKLPYTEGQEAMTALVAAIRGSSKRNQSIDPVDSPLGRKIGPLVTKQSLAKDPSFKGQWDA